MLMTDNLFSQILMPFAIAYIMFGIGANIDLGDFNKTFRRPKALVTGLAAQILVLPIIAFTLNMFFDIDPIYKVGLVLIAACPGGTTSNIVTLFLKGRLALSVALTALNSFIILFTIPFIMKFALVIYEGLEQDIKMPIMETIGNMSFTVLAPTILGMLIRYYLPMFVSRAQKTINISMTIFLLFVFAGFFTFENSGTENLSEYAFLFVPALILNAASMFAGYLLALIMSITNRGRFTIAIQVGLQNSALAIYVASKLLGQTEMAVIAIIYSSFSLFSTALWAYIMKKYL
jgi:BASS family bile acid:Na+ symporter